MGSLRGRRCCVCDGGSVKGSSETEMGLAAWVERREERLGLRENEGKYKENKKERRQMRRRGRRREPKKNEGNEGEIGAKREACERESETYFIKQIYIYIYIYNLATVGC